MKEESKSSVVKRAVIFSFVRWIILGGICVGVPLAIYGNVVLGTVPRLDTMLAFISACILALIFFTIYMIIEEEWGWGCGGSLLVGLVAYIVMYGLARLIRADFMSYALFCIIAFSLGVIAGFFMAMDSRHSVATKAVIKEKEQLLRKNAETGDAQALYELGELLYDKYFAYSGNKASGYRKEAFGYFEEAANKGNEKAIRRLERDRELDREMRTAICRGCGRSFDKYSVSGALANNSFCSWDCTR